MKKYLFPILLFTASIGWCAWPNGSGGGGGSSGGSIGSAVTGGTTGSVLFVGSGGLLAQNNSNLFWDNTNARLGIGTTVPGFTLDVYGNFNTTGTISAAGASSSIISPNTTLPMGAGNASTAMTLYTTSASFVNQSTMSILQSGFLGLGTSNPTQQFQETGLPGTNATTAFFTSSDTVVKMMLQAQTVAGGFVLFGSNSNHPLEVAINNGIVANWNANGGLLLGGSSAAGTFVRLDVSTGTFKLPRYTTAQSDLITPSTDGQLIWNTNLVLTCVSTGTGAGAWTRINSSSSTPCR